MALEDLVISELQKVEHRKGARNYVICCPFHDDSTPSMNVNIDPSNRKAPLGWGYCLGCGASKPWNDIADKLGLVKISKEGEVTHAATVRKQDPKLKEALLPQKASMTMAEIAKIFKCAKGMPILPDDDWRGFSGKFLRKIGCEVTVDEYDNKCLILPAYVDGELVGAIKAMWEAPKSKKIPKYLNLDGEWSKTHGLFPYDYVRKMIKKKALNYVVLVEGSRDALRLVKKGIPALAILGTQSWSKEKERLILDIGVDKVVVMMDGDNAGVDASNMIMKSLKGKITRQLIKMMEYTIKNKGEKVDPGNIKRKYLKEIKEMIEQ